MSHTEHVIEHGLLLEENKGSLEENIVMALDIINLLNEESSRSI